MRKVESSTRYITIDEAYAIADALGVTVAEMCDPEPMTMRVETVID